MNNFQINFTLEQIYRKMSKTETTTEAATNSGAAKVADLGILEEDDEFE